ncbi:MAG: CRISPR-associated endonuclease Cas2 [Candidatus Lindowbacteria bacterium RIFCSPLOWO2_12_FULL_62_27]|nr:MAG: CRISPR-associated endonuclease Cas2 [Candidatus Lindowbacteria bacterium RIFCSPLOWO2_02_FULL_62_12]OGH61329.1 MAG: CRISPR-associated endonuclease Cas2 [Candidatus Lindowbacteria bacterium RIFCSPLOWO2_12_FULL_62_27]
MPETHIVSYDIRHPKRLRRVAKTCQDFGCRRQLSVFLCRISPVDLIRLKDRLNEIIDRKNDQILFIRLCQSCGDGIESLGQPTLRHDVTDVCLVI